MPFNLFLVLIFTPFVLSSDSIFNDDVLGLIVFKAGLRDPEDKLMTWNEDDDNPCGWVGIKCNPNTRRVTEIVLDGFSLSGHIDRGLLRLQFLQTLSLSRNNFSGTINPALGRHGSLQVIDLSENSISGSIPSDFFLQCGSLRSVSFARNLLTGHIPESLSSSFKLTAVNFSSNQLSGEIPPPIWYLRRLQSLDLSDNLLEGVIPLGIKNLSDLTTINLQKNRLRGKIPDDIGDCSLLKLIDFSENFLSGSFPSSISRLSSCSSLSLRGNSFTGEIPEWIGELKDLQTLDLSANNFSGKISSSIGNLQLLKTLNVSMNKFTGNLPDSMQNCTNLLSFDASNNLLTATLPSWIFRPDVQKMSAFDITPSKSLDYLSFPSNPNFHPVLQVLDLSSNGFYGQISFNIEVLRRLMLLNLSRNSLQGPIPKSISELKSVQIIDLSNNLLNGSIPSEIGGTLSVKELRLEKNFLSGKIPAEIEKCSSLTSLILSQNNLSGQIPASIGNLTKLQYADLSLNQLSGSLPKELTNLSHLLSFNVSHNHLQGELPVGGFFNTISPSSLSDNPLLCGAVVNQSCPAVHPKPIVLNPNSSNSNSSSANHPHNKIILSISTLIAIGAAAFIALGVVAVTLLNIHARSSMLRSNAALALSGGEEFSCSPQTNPNYGKLVMFSGDADFVTGTQALLNKDCELGRGGFGVVYKSVLRDGRSVAIKKLTVSSLIKSQESFENEVKNFGKIRHHNLVTLEGYYWTPSLQLLIFEYVPNGSLYNHLHGDISLPWRLRFNIILGIAKGLAHLHMKNIIHYNLKSTNILLDNSCEPKIGDFGLARLLPMLDHCILSSKIQSALGYMAPEFACKTVKITEKCDLYGFGILVLEVVTGKKPVEYMEDDVIVLCDMVRGALEEGRVEECIDGRLSGNFVAEEAIPVIKLGLVCSSQVPSSRPDMNEVVNILELIQSPSEAEDLE